MVKAVFLKCANPGCNRERDSRFVIRSIGNRAYCTLNCLNAGTRRIKPARIVRIRT